MRAMLIERSSVHRREGRPDLMDKIIPDYPLGGKRSVRDNGVWIEALKRPNVELVTEPITEITPEGLVTADGVDARGRRHHLWHRLHTPADFLKTYKVVRQGGVELHERGTATRAPIWA